MLMACNSDQERVKSNQWRIGTEPAAQLEVAQACAVQYLHWFPVEAAQLACSKFPKVDIYLQI